jgi:hypothetical protein
VTNSGLSSSRIASATIARAAGESTGSLMLASAVPEPSTITSPASSPITPKSSRSFAHPCCTVSRADQREVQGSERVRDD